MPELEKDTWGRIPGMCHRAKGKTNQKGWYYRNEFIAVELREAYRIIRERLKENENNTR